MTSATTKPMTAPTTKAPAETATGPAPCCDGAGPAPTQLPPEPRLDLPAPEVADAVATAALLADRTRAGIVRMLADGPLCVCELAAALGEKQNNVSMHLARLREAGLVRAVRHSGDARWMFYERDNERCAAAAASLTDLLR
jgi:DNA-binding transcriptional ArsR family regulator